MRRVGVLGGMGPEATVMLMQRVIAATPARDDVDHVPLLVDQYPQVPSRIAYLVEGRGADPGPVLVEMALALQAAGAQALAMPCNTAHHFAPLIASAVSIPLLDMVALSATVARSQAEPGAPIGILASPAVRSVGVFERAFGDDAPEILYPIDQDALLSAIRLIKSGQIDGQARAIFRAASVELKGRGAQTQLVACTEFSLISEAIAQGAQAIDSLDQLVQAIVHFAKLSAGDTSSGLDQGTLAYRSSVGKSSDFIDQP